MSARLTRFVPAVAATVLVFLFLLSQRKHTVVPEALADGAAVAVRSVAARTAEIPVFAEAVGTVRSRRQTQIAARVVAEIKEIRHVPGESVNAGDTLVILDDRDLRNRVDQAEAQRRARENARAEAELEMNRAKGLLGSGAITRQQVDSATFRFATTQAELEAADKDLQLARINLGYATIQAPFAGWIFEKYADPGDLALPGRSILAIYDPHQLRMETVVEEAHLWRIKLGDTLEVAVDALGKTVVGRVSEVVPSVDPSSRTGMAKLDLPADDALRPGMFGRTRIPIGRRRALLVPRAAVVMRGQLAIVFVVSENGERALLRLVRTGEPQADDTVEIRTGLADGESVVVTDASQLEDDARITTARGSGK